MRKISVHFGINKFSPSYYGEGNDLRGCENDAKYMEKIARQKQFETHLYLSEKATYNVFIDHFNRAAEELQSGDIFFFSSSCHGTYNDEGHERKTALCLYDRIVWDAETKQLLMKFKKGVLIIWMTDCCHSRDNFKTLKRHIIPSGGNIKFLDFSNIKQAVSEPEETKNLDFKCNIIAYSSSTEQQVSYDLESLVDGRPMGLYTAAFEKLFLDPKNKTLSYYQTYKKLFDIMSKQGYPQTPKLQTVNGYKEKIAHRQFLS